MPRRRKTLASVHELKITLRDTKPPIWRRVAMPSSFTLGQLHEVIQIAMGWCGGHLHQFILKSTTPPRLSPKEFVRLLDEEHLSHLGTRLRGEQIFTDLSIDEMEGEDEYAFTIGEVCPEVNSLLNFGVSGMCFEGVVGMESARRA